MDVVTDTPAGRPALQELPRTESNLQACSNRFVREFRNYLSPPVASYNPAETAKFGHTVFLDLNDGHTDRHMMITTPLSGTLEHTTITGITEAMGMPCAVIRYRSEGVDHFGYITKVDLKTRQYTVYDPMYGRRVEPLPIDTTDDKYMTEDAYIALMNNDNELRNRYPDADIKLPNGKINPQTEARERFWQARIAYGRHLQAPHGDPEQLSKFRRYFTEYILTANGSTTAVNDSAADLIATNTYDYTFDELPLPFDIDERTQLVQNSSIDRSLDNTSCGYRILHQALLRQGLVYSQLNDQDFPEQYLQQLGSFEKQTGAHILEDLYTVLDPGQAKQGVMNTLMAGALNLRARMAEFRTKVGEMIRRKEPQTEVQTNPFSSLLEELSAETPSRPVEVIRAELTTLIDQQRRGGMDVELEFKNDLPEDVAAALYQAKEANAARLRQGTAQAQTIFKTEGNELAQKVAALLGNKPTGVSDLNIPAEVMNLLTFEQVEDQGNKTYRMKLCLPHIPSQYSTQDGNAPLHFQFGFNNGNATITPLRWAADLGMWDPDGMQSIYVRKGIVNITTQQPLQA